MEKKFCPMLCRMVSVKKRTTETNQKNSGKPASVCAACDGACLCYYSGCCML